MLNVASFLQRTRYWLASFASRPNMLTALITGQALTAASVHLAKLVERGYWFTKNTEIETRPSIAAASAIFRFLLVRCDRFNRLTLTPA